MEEERKHFLDLRKMPMRMRETLRRLTLDMLGFDPWQRDTWDWSWMRQFTGEPAERQMRIPLHTACGYLIGLHFYATLIGVVSDDEVGLNGDTYQLEFYERLDKPGTRSGWYLKVTPWGEASEHHKLDLFEEVDEQQEDPGRLLLSAIRLAMAERREQRLRGQTESSVELD